MRKVVIPKLDVSPNLTIISGFNFVKVVEYAFNLELEDDILENLVIVNFEETFDIFSYFDINKETSIDILNLNIEQYVYNNRLFIDLSNSETEQYGLFNKILEERNDAILIVNSGKFLEYINLTNSIKNIFIFDNFVYHYEFLKKIKNKTSQNLISLVNEQTVKVKMKNLRSNKIIKEFMPK